LQNGQGAFIRDSEQKGDVICRLVSLAVALLPAMAVCLAAGVAVCVDVIALRTGCAESALVELSQLVCLLSTGSLAACAAVRCPRLRGGFVLISGLFFSMAMREMDWALDNIAHGCWVYPAVAIATVAIAVAVRRPGSTLAGLERVRAERNFQLLAVGLFAVFALSRILGYKGLWMAAGNFGYLRIAKRIAEESMELFGYLLILCWAIIFFARYVCPSVKNRAHGKTADHN